MGVVDMSKKIWQGSTPIHTFTIPYKRNEVSNAVVSYRQNNKNIFEKSNNEIEINDNLIIVRLTQKDTLSFADVGDVAMQIKVKLHNGDVIPSNKMYAKLESVFNKEEI